MDEVGLWALQRGSADHRTAAWILEEQSPAVSKNLRGVEDTKGTYSDGAAKQTPQFYL